ncbi:MAG TPA: M4 family metallopeptidase [Armatimonadota bacterium]|jgi:Zn-dependent metalloprotease
MTKADRAPAQPAPSGVPISFPSLTQLKGLPAASLRSQAVYVGPATLQPQSSAGLSAIQPLGAAALPQGISISRLQRSENGAVRWLEGRLGPVPAATAAATSVAPPPSGPAQVLAPLAQILRLQDPAAEMRIVSSSTDERGWRNLRFEQIFRGLRVYARDIYLHVDTEGQLRIINGEYDPTPRDVDTTPSITGQAALATVQADLTAKGRWAPADSGLARSLGYEEPSAELVVHTLSGTARLAYAVSVRPNLLEWWVYIVDAHTGSIVDRIPQFCSAAFADASAVDLNGVTQAMRSWRNDAGTYYLLWDLPNFNAATSVLPDNMVGGVTTLDLRGHDAVQASTIYYVTSTTNAWTDPAAVSAHIDSKAAYDYYRNTFQRKAIDDKDTTIASIVHVTDGGLPMDNAYWNGRAMFYGDGASLFKPLAGGLDVAGHEMTHGVIQNTANLDYQAQSGALNESFADVFGVMIGSPNYLIGSTIMRPGQGIALRDLGQPDNPNVASPQPATMAAYVNTSQDNGGVHTNSGIPNHAAALIITAIGREKTQRIYYKALTTYLTRTSQFADCRNAVEQAAKDLYGVGAEVTAVDNAFDAVGIKAVVVPPPGTDIPAVTGGVPTVTFLLPDGSIGLLDMVKLQWAAFGAAVKARVDANLDDPTQLSTPLNGGSIWYIDSTGHLAYVDLVANQLFSFPNLHIQQDGDLWNAAVSPDGSAVAVTSSSATDRNIYVYTGVALYAIPLDLVTPDGKAKDTSIVHPGVVSWSPNMGFPKIGFDALHQINVNGVTLDYWGMGEINFTTSTVYDLVPGQTTSTQLGNLSYSNTSPNVIAYNAITFNWDTVIRRNGDDTALNIPYILLTDNTFLTDGQRPTFSPDDKQVCFTSPARKWLAFYDLTANSLQAFSLSQGGSPVAVYNARWFVQAGVVPYTFADVRRALFFSAGVGKAAAADLTRLNLVDTAPSDGKITVVDAVRIARKVTGLQP